MAITGPVAGILADHANTLRVTLAVSAAAIALIVSLQASGNQRIWPGGWP